MKSVFILLSVGMILSCSTPTNQNSTITDASDIDELKEIQQNLWVKAYSEQDTALLSQILHADYQLIDDNGDWYTKQDELALLSSYPPSYTSQEFEIIEIDLIGNGTAIVLAKATLKGADEAEAYITTYVTSTTFVKLSDTWSALNSHVSGVREERFPMAETNN